MEKSQSKFPKGKGKSVWGPGGDRYEFLVTGAQSGGSVFAMQAYVPPGGGPPPHSHSNESESYYLEQGELEFLIDSEVVGAKAGDFIHIPKGAVHSFLNKGTGEATMLTVYAPAGIEGWFEEAFVSATGNGEEAVRYSKEQIDFMIETGPKYGVMVLSP